MRIVIDCDPGNGVPGANTDDGLALGLAVASPHLELELVTTVAGNTPVELGTAVARGLFRAWGAGAPVVTGAPRPLLQDPGVWRSRLDGADMSEQHRRLWDGFTVPEPATGAAGDGQDAARAIGTIVSGNPGQITILAIGPLTNIALAMRLYPRLAREVAGIVVMGGALKVPGRPVDTNFGYDPHAAREVLASGAPLTVVPLDATMQTIFTATDLERLRRIGSPMAASLARTTEPWLRYSTATRGIQGCWLHDVVVVAMCIDPSIVTSTPASLSVSLETPPGRLIRRPLHGLAQRATLAEGVDNARLLDLFFRMMTEAAKNC